MNRIRTTGSSCLHCAAVELAEQIASSDDRDPLPMILSGGRIVFSIPPSVSPEEAAMVTDVVFDRLNEIAFRRITCN